MSENELISRIMTVARIFEPGAEHVEVVFLESAMFYRLSQENPNFSSLLATLQAAVEKGTPVEVRLRSLDSDLIENVRAIN